MTDPRFVALETALVEAWRAGAPDANGRPPERAVSDDDTNRCRHCLGNIRAGEAMLIVAHRPFATLQPYAEVGPLFVHAAPCPRYAQGARLPAAFTAAPAFLMRGYGLDDRIVYGTGEAVPTGDIARRATALLTRDDVAYLHLRSARYNCYQCRIERG